MTPCFLRMAHKVSKPWPAAGVSTSTRCDPADYADLSLGEEAPDTNGGKRRRIGIYEAFTQQYVSRNACRIY